jgi:hypothetical protein
MKKIIIGIVSFMLFATTLWAQTTNADRMERDLRVAEDVLSSLIKQQFDKNAWLPVDVEASYRSGYGVTFSVPNFSNFHMNGFVFPKAPRAPKVGVYNGPGTGYSYSIETDEEGNVISEIINGDEDEEMLEQEREAREAEKEALKEEAKALKQEAEALKEESRALAGTRGTNKRLGNLNGLGSVGSTTANDIKENNKHLIEAAKTFLADYTSILSQLKPEERIVITNRNADRGNRYWAFMGDEKRYFLSIEVNGNDVKQYQVGKLTHDQFINTIKTVESEVTNERIQDLELLITIFDRLYQPDLSKTYFTEEDTYYERLKDFGAVFYMNVYSSNQVSARNENRFSMPTLGLQNVDQATRDKKVTELYPTFEKELKENILEYGRTLKTLKPTEVLSFNVKITKCKGCGIPSTVELTVKASVLSDYLSGKLDKNEALAKMEVKKGAEQ